ncbi:uncharacterized protein FIBRA_04276 [Fibroporia radiculosa]|uniref:RBR-type E3 ubiquitin transferase n=1 Tax=Fibroporia radiculosa TaxID=599839 RepID=J4IA30_9APHY|nr:uncharacterized protein FIBRA_04276 [Fibroporia radiculosa]CCM02196.1 predicted protein [Fibroporia radiculosa]
MAALRRPDQLDEEYLTECVSLQEEEWEVLESIYPECVSSDMANGNVKLEIPIEFLEPRSIAVVSDRSLPAANGTLRASSASRSGPSHLSLSTLPPLLLDVLLPPSYPYRPPVIASLHATHSWFTLGLDSELQKKLLEMWQDGEGVLYAWVEWIRGGELFAALDLVSTVDGEEVIRHNTTSSATCTSYICEVCLTSIKGARCILLSCSHVFCRACLEDFWKLCITEGDIGRVGCPDPQCIKSGREANEEEVRRVVTEEEVRRWKWLREKRELEKGKSAGSEMTVALTITADPTIIHCPMSFCQRPVPKGNNVEEGTGWERLRTCPDCDYSFCAYCKRTWHGPLSDCPISVTETFVLEYLALPEGSPGRLVMERRFGPKNIRKLVARYEEERANERWLAQSTMACPSCHVHVEKSLGCNHMTCAKCKQHFCYRCGEKLQESNPYEHFSTPGRQCYSKLFDFQSIEDEWQPVEGFDLL